jgi:voltage-gated potassium channel
MATRHRWLPHRLLGAHAAVLYAGIVAVLSLATGLANITVGVTTGPLAGVVPELVQQTAGFTGTLTGFLMLLGVWGLRRRRRAGWYLVMALLPLTAVQGLVQASLVSLPLVVLSVLSAPAVAVNYRRFNRPVSLSNAQVAALIALSATLTYGTVGAFALRDEFTDVTTLTDAFYYAIVTATTVGYGDTTPTSQEARLFGISVVVLGAASFAVALGSVLGPAIEARFARALGTMTDTDYELFEDHVLVLGYGDLTEPLLDELAGECDTLIVVPDGDSATLLRNHGYDVFVGDPSDDEPLLEAGIERARAVIAATENDADDAFAILTARELNPGVRIVAAATAQENIQKLERAGADDVISPAVIGGQMLVRSALDGAGVDPVEEALPDDEARNRR